MAIVREGSGTHFDPRVVAAMEACQAQMAAIATHWRD
jgi:HD-GYP domain-containing protein (c-di-GMP phosphodiesterase class II)